jgi:BRCT domain type II-containing protein
VIGKEELARKFNEVGLIYDKGPIVNSMALVIRCDIKPGESKVQQAKEKGIPVVSEALAIQLIEEMKR